MKKTASEKRSSLARSAARSGFATRLAIVLTGLLVRLPGPARRLAGRCIGRAGQKLSASRRHIVETNLRLCFPELSEAERRRLARDNFSSFGESVLETAGVFLGRAPKVSLEAIPSWLAVKNFSLLEAARAEGRGVLLVGLHLDSLDLGCALLGQLVKMDVMYRKHKNPAMQTLLQEGRGQYFNEVIERRNVKRLVRRLREGHTVWYGPDQDYGRHHAEFVPFFGVPAATLTATARIARLTGARLLSFIHYREPGGRYRMELHRLSGPVADDKTFTAELNQWFEQCIRRHPEQYMWLHRRFKTRPPGEAGFYRD